MRTVARRARWWAADYLYAANWILRGVLAAPPDSYLSGDKRPIVIVPGVWESWTFLIPLITPLHRAGYPVHVITGLGWNTRSVVETAQKIATYLEAHDLRDVVIIAHSKGGLIGKYVMTLLDDQRRISSMVAVASPFSGSRYAQYFFLRSLRAFSPRDPTTVLLKRNVSANARIVSIFGVFDPHIPEGSALDGATNIEINLGGHFQILGDSTVMQTVMDAAATPTDVTEG